MKKILEPAGQLESSRVREVTLELIDQRRLVSLDIETEPLEAFADKEKAGLVPQWSRITCVGVHDGEHSIVYRDLGALYRDILSDPSFFFVGHNLSFDIKHLLSHKSDSFDVDSWLHDTQLMAYVSTSKIDPAWLDSYEVERAKRNNLLPHGAQKHRQARQHSLKTLAPYFLGVEPFWEDPTNHDNDEYVLKDASYTFRLLNYFITALTDQEMFFYFNRQMDWARMLARAEAKGVVFNAAGSASLYRKNEELVNEHLEKMKQAWASPLRHWKMTQAAGIREAFATRLEKAGLDAGKIQKIEERISKRIAEEAEFNFASPQQLKWLLSGQLGLDLRNEEGKESTDKEVLNALVEQNPQMPELASLLEYKRLQKVNTAFLPTYEELVDNNGEIHPFFNASNTKTGRLSSELPNMQQVPQELKTLFVPRPGHKFISYDFTAIEPTILAYYSEDRRLCDIVTNPELSLHSVTAHSMFSLDCAPEEVAEKFPVARRIAKTIGLAVLYGAGWRQVQIACKKFNVHFDEHKCREVVYKIRDSYKNVWAFKKSLDVNLEEGAVIYNLLGRPIQFSIAGDVYMQGMNRLIQSSASDLCLAAASAASEIAKPLLFVHDSILFEVPADKAESVDKQIKELLESVELKTRNGYTIQTRVEGGICESGHWE